MGEVYLAHDTRLGRKVAIKALLVDSSTGPHAPHQLFQEARAAAALTHPNIAAIHDVIESDGCPMIVMEYVPGQSLDARLRSERPSVEQAIEWTLQTANALTAAHAHDIIHCDIKPANIRLTPDGTIKVLDFGVARIRSLTTVSPGEARSATSATTVSTPSGGGTPPYMAPEQLLSQRVDPRTDVYALGVVLFELLAGRRPFQAPDNLALSLQILSDPAPAVTDVNPAVPQAVAEIVSRAMARRPADRYESAAAFADALRRARDLLTADRLPGTARELPAGRLIRTRWGAALAVSLVLALTTAVAVGVRWRRFAAPAAGDALRNPVVAVLPLRNLTGESENEYLSAGVTDVVTTKLAALPGARVLSTSAAVAYREGADRVDRVTRDLGATLVVEGSLQRAGNRLLVTASLIRADSRNIVWSGTFNAKVEDIFSLQRQLTDGLIEGLRSAGALKDGLTTRDRARLGGAPTADVDAFANYAQARSFLERPDVSGSLDRAATLLDVAIQSDPKFALAHAALGETYWAQYERTRDQAWIAKARDETLEALRLDPDQAGVRFSLAVIYNGTGRSAQAVDELQRAIALQPAGDDAHRLLGEIIARGGEIDRAVGELREAVDLRPSYWGNHYSLGLALYNAGRYRDAIPPFQRVAQLQPDSARGFQALGTAYHQGGDLANALTNYQRAIQLNPTAGAYANIGTIHYGLDHFGEAARAYEQAIALAPGSSTARRNVADAYEALGEREKARDAYEKAVELSRGAMKVNPRDARALALQALCEVKLGLSAEAGRDIENAIKLAPTDKEVLYKRAVIRTLTGDSAGALQSLADALAHGYSATLVRSDRDMRTLRSMAEFARLVGTPR